MISQNSQRVVSVFSILIYAFTICLLLISTAAMADDDFYDVFHRQHAVEPDDKDDKT